MPRSQLQTVLRIESEREEKAARQFMTAKQELHAQQQKLSQLQQYRVDYIQGVKRSGGEGVASTRYQQHLSFVGKLDLACEQQLNIISKATLKVDHLKQDWIEKQRRKNAIAKLIEKQHLVLKLKEQKHEQQLMDEFANQQTFRKRFSKLRSA